MFVNYTNVMKMDIVDRHNRLLGRPYDFLVKFGSVYPQMTSLVFAKGVFERRYAVIPWAQVKKVEEKVYLNISEENLVFVKDYRNDEYASLKHSILDQQVVDTFNRKVVRVNDIHFLRVDKDLRIAHVDVGFRALVRRLGWESLVDTAVKIFWPRAKYLGREHYISWKFVQPLEVVSKKGTLQLNVSNEDLAAIPPADLSEIISELDPPERAALFRSLDFETQVDVLNELEVPMQKDLMKEMETNTAIRLIERMDSDEVVDFLEGLSKKEARHILSLLSPAKARRLSSILKYESDSAGGVMTMSFVALTEDMTVSEAFDKIRSEDLDIEMIYYLYVMDGEGHLKGVVTVKRLIMASLEDKIKDIMLGRPVTAPADASAKEVAFLMDKYDFLAVPVVDDEKKMKGVITIDDILALAIDEAWGEKPGLL